MAKAQANTAFTSSGKPSRSRSSGGGGSDTCLRSIASVASDESPKGWFPLSISYRTRPSEYTSLRPSRLVSPAHCSGLM